MKKFLIVEGQTPARLKEMQTLQRTVYHQQFSNLVMEEVPHAAIDVAFPAQLDFKLPSVRELQQYTGVLWTGSSLRVMDQKTEVLRQIEFAQDVFKSHVPFYGSCWGLQVATVAAGGQVRDSPNGIEIGITTPIKLTDKGKKHFLLKKRSDNFQSFCVHYDEVEKLPARSTVLASNQHSSVQAAQIEFEGGVFVGVQYHPEFQCQDMLGLLKEMGNTLTEQHMDTDEGIEDFMQNLQKEINLPEEVLHYPQHSVEIRNWLHFTMSSMTTTQMT